MNINLVFTSFFISKKTIMLVLGLLQTAAIIVPIVLAILLVIKYLSTKTNIKYYEKHLDQENSEIRLAEEKENLEVFKYKLKKDIVIAIVCIALAIALSFAKFFIK